MASQRSIRRDRLTRALLLLALLTGNAAQAGPRLGPAPGEELEFNIRWVALPAGVGTFRFLDADQEGYVIEAGLRSIGPVKALYPVQDELRSQGVARKGGFSSLLYEKHELARAEPRHSTFRYDRTGARVGRSVNGEDKGWIPEVGEAFNDLLASFYSVRTEPDTAPGRAWSLQVFEKKKRYRADVRVGDRVRLTTPLGFFQAKPLVVAVAGSDAFRGGEDLVVWLSDDERRLPLRVEVNVTVGHVAADLVGYKDGRGEEKHLRDKQFEE